MTERLPRSDEENWDEILGTPESSGGFLKVAFNPDGTLKGAFLAPFSRAGTLAVDTGKGRFTLPAAATIVGVTAAVSTAPTGASVIVDVNKNGTTIFSTQGNRPTIPASSFASSTAVPDITSLAVGDYLTVDVDQVGSTIPGADLVVIIAYRYS